MSSPSGPFRVTTFKGVRVLPTGVSEWDLRSGRYRRLFTGVYVARESVLNARLRAEAALLLVDEGSCVSHHSAARIWRGVVPDDGHEHVTYVGRRPRVSGLQGHQPKPDQRVLLHRGIRVTTPLQTFLDLAAELDLVELVVLGDSLVKRGHVTPEGLVRAAAEYRGRNRAIARRAAGLVRRGVDSPMESRLRMLIVLAGLPEPVVDYRIHWANGELRFRLDLSYPDFKIVIEYDGLQHAESTEQWQTDRERREWLDDEGWRLLVTVARDIYSTPAATLSRVTKVMRSKGMRVPKLREEWRQYFESKPGDLAEPA